MGLIALIVAHALTAVPTPAERAVSDLSLRQVAGHAILLRFAGNPAPAYVLRTLARGEAAGVILFRDNATDRESTRRLTRTLQASAHHRAIIATDQEGGAIRILGWAQPVAGQSQVPTPEAAQDNARAAARDLRYAGVNLNLAPVADGNEAIMATRGFPGRVAQRAKIVAAAVRGYRGTRVRPTLKHFPGLGAADGNTDKARVTIDRPARTIGTEDLPPFAAGIDAGAPAVMLSHAVYPQLDRHAVASQSREIVTGLLKDRLHFTGVAMTDSLEAYSVRSRMSMETAAVRSVRAGIDLVLTTGRGTHIRALRALVAEARRDPAFRTRLKDAAARVIALQGALRSR